MIVTAMVSEGIVSYLDRGVGVFFFSSRRRHTRYWRDWSSDVCSSDLPYSRSFERGAIPRIRTSHAGWNGERDFAFSYWMHELEQNPTARFVSDGDPKVVSVRAGSEADVRPALRSRMRVTR